MPNLSRASFSAFLYHQFFFTLRAGPPSYLSLMASKGLSLSPTSTKASLAKSSKAIGLCFALLGWMKIVPFWARHMKISLDQTVMPRCAWMTLFLRAFVVRQLNPGDNTSIYHIFERLNTGGTFLNPQEVRNCVRHGKLNDLLVELNSNPDWRLVYGKPQPDKRLRDVELILRFLALYYDSGSYSKPMKDFLNKFMDAHRNPDDGQLEEYTNLFARTAAAVASGLGPKSFHIRAGLNAAVFDSVFVAFARNLEHVPADVRQRYDTLLQNSSYTDAVGSRTTDDEVVRERLELAARFLFG